MKVFVRTDSLTGEEPIVIASYADDADVPDNAHGEGTTILNVPMHVIRNLIPGGERTSGSPFLARNWRQAAGDVPVRAEARRRIEEAFPISEQLASLHEAIDAVLSHGADVGKWPADVRQRKTEFDRRWKYVAEVSERAKTHVAAAPHDPASDKIWPRRPAKP